MQIIFHQLFYSNPQATSNDPHSFRPLKRFDQTGELIVSYYYPRRFEKVDPKTGAIAALDIPIVCDTAQCVRFVAFTGRGEEKILLVQDIDNSQRLFRLTDLGWGPRTASRYQNSVRTSLEPGRQRYYFIFKHRCGSE